ncbi:hypothetical protein BKA61DRAFT_550051 [Leptodontidium sp. MPI-SDFR-AT-0119]|nr:hypothetical protein BKA61DRAFT_550051 [Leptodontidium sp. MPI-SDFR-AT-0119]
MCVAPNSAWTKKAFIDFCATQFCREVSSPEEYGIFSGQLKTKVYPARLWFEQNFLQSHPHEILKVIVKHTKLMLLEKLIYLLPAATVRDMTTPVEILAEQVAHALHRTIFVHLLPNKGFRVGEVKDEEDEKSVAGLKVVCQFYPFNALDVQSIDPNPFGSANTAYHIATIGGDAPAYERLKQVSRAKRNEIPKPENSWVLYLKARYEEVKKANPHEHACEISKIIAGLWAVDKETEVGKFFKDLAKSKKAEHTALYGNYKVKPRKSSEIKRRNAKKIMVLLQADHDEDAGGNDDTFNIQEFNDFPGPDFKYTGQDVSGMVVQDGFNVDGQAASDVGIQGDFDSAGQVASGTGDSGSFFFSDQAHAVDGHYNLDTGNTMASYNSNLGTVLNEEAVGFEDNLARLANFDCSAFATDLEKFDHDLPGHDYYSFLEAAY